MRTIRRWVPLIGTALVCGAVIARTLGYELFATAAEQVGSLTGASGQSAVSPVEVSAALAGLSGVVLKVVAQVRKALAQDDMVVTQRY